MNIDENIDFGYCDFNLKEIMEKKEVNVSLLAPSRINRIRLN